MSLAIETRNLTVEFPSRQGTLRALDRLTLRVEPGQVFGFLGPNGAGKTTTMHVLLGFLGATSGEALLFDEDVRQSIARRRIGYVAEHPDTYRFLTGRELLTLTGRLFGLRSSALSNRVATILDQVGMTAAARRRIATYSRGMLQRICLAQALVNNPDLLILDEPTSGLDPLGRLEVRRLIGALRDQGKTVFFSSHELSEVELVCDRVAILSHGRLVAEGRASELVRDNESLERYFMRIVAPTGPQP